MAWSAAASACGSRPDWRERITSEWAGSGGAGREGEGRRGNRRKSGSPESPLLPSSPLPHSPLLSALCLVPAGVEPGQDVNLSERRFDLLVSEPVEFPLYVSSTRLTDRPGELVTFDREQMTPLPPIRTVLRTRKKGETETVAVNLHARLTEIGTLDLWCSEIEGKRSWRLQFDVRSATQTDVAAHESAAEGEGFVDEATWQECLAAIRQVFGPDGAEKPEGLVKRLSAATGMNRNAWPTSLCRRIWEALIDDEAGRRKGPVHEARWLNLLGFGLRPGYGLAVDDWRVAETWRLVQGKLVHPSAASRLEGWILWRRIGGGLLAGQQQALAEPLLGPIRGLHRLVVGGKGARRRFRLPAQRNGRDLAAAGLAGTAAGVAEDRVGRNPAGPLAQAEDGDRAAGDRLGRRPLGRADAALRSLEYGRARRDGRPMAEAADRFLRRRSGRAAGGDADRAQDRRSLSRSFARSSATRRPPI